MTTPLEPRPYDLIVVGGGPGGAAAATFVAMRGHRVLLLEKGRLPRHRIGESLLPATVHGICRLLGVHKAVGEAGFVRKRGGTFIWGSSDVPWTFAFSENPKSPIGYAYQVRRAEFDQILVDNARAKGAEVREGHAVTGLVLDGERVVGVRYTDAEGRPGVAHARFVIGAEGQHGRIHRHVGERVVSDTFRNVAVYGYYEGAGRLPAPNAGNILTVAFESGWFWFIPLSDRLTSVGAVITRDHVDRIQTEPRAALDALIEACAPVAELLRGAAPAREAPYDSVRICKDYSYCHDRFWRPGVALVGDAACFVDPVFSSGVHLATYSALLAARTVNSCLAGLVDEAAAFEEFEHRYRTEYTHFYEFLLGFYDMNRARDDYFWQARRVTGGEGRDRDAFVRLVAGFSSTGLDQVPEDGFFEARAGLGPWMEQRLADEVEGMEPVGAGDEAGDFQPVGFLKGTSSAMGDMQTLGLLGARRPGERPRRPGGLVASADGLHWRARAGLDPL